MSADIQVTDSMVSEDVRRRELAPLQRIRDNYERIILSVDTGLDSSYDGIKCLNLIQWLPGHNHAHIKRLSETAGAFIYNVLVSVSV